MNRIILLVWILLLLLNCKQAIYLQFDYRIVSCCCHRYMQRSRLKANCWHSFVACERSDVADPPTGHYNYNIWTASVAVKWQINKESLLCPRISLNIIYVLSTFGVFQSLQYFEDIVFRSKISDRVTCYCTIHSTWILQPGSDIKQIRNSGIFMQKLHFRHNQNISNSRYYKNIVIRINCIVKLEWQMEIFHWKLNIPLLVTKNFPHAGKAT